MRLLPEPGSRASRTHRSTEGITDRLCFAPFRSDTQHPFGRTESGYGEGESVLGDHRHIRKMPFTDLLLTASLVQPNQLDRKAIVKIRHRRVVKCQGAIFTDAQAAKVDRLRFEQLAIPLTFIERLSSVPSQVMKYFRTHPRLNTLAHITTKTRRVIRVQAEIFVHVKKRHFGPIDPSQRYERLEKLNLRVAGRQDRGCRSLFLNPLSQIPMG